MPRLLRISAAVVTVVALALSCWSFWRWETPLSGNALTNPFQFDGLSPPSWSDALPSVVPLLVIAIGIAMLLLNRANRHESHAAADRQPIKDVGADTAAGPRHSQRLRILASVTAPEVMTMFATVVVICCALTSLFVLTLPGLRWKTVTGFSMMIELVDFTGLLSPVAGWIVLVVLLFVSLTTATLLYANAKPIGQAKNGDPTSNEGRR